MVRIIHFCLLAALLAFFGGCVTYTQVTDPKKLKTIKTVAIVMYTVPEKIIYRASARAEEDEAPSLLSQAISLANATVFAGSGEEAAETSYRNFVDALQAQAHFKVLDADKVLGNPAVQEAARIARKAYKKRIAALPKKETKKEGALGKLAKLSLFGAKKEKKGYSPRASSPKGLPNFGVSRGWTGSGSPLTNLPEERAFLKAVAKALKVDGLLVIMDGGYSFNCAFGVILVGTQNCTGTANTGSAFVSFLLDAETQFPVLYLREWFAVTDSKAPVAVGIIAPTFHKGLYEGHGRKMAKVYLERLKEEEITIGK